jgi:hypothetical protein
MLRRIRSCCTLVALLLAQPTLLLHPLRAQAADCRFVLGFQTIHDLIPAIVGDCLGDEQHDPLTGDGSQATTGGLLVWRKAENYTAFTDGNRTWINGPYGLQSRLNTERLSWETLTIDALKNATYQFFDDTSSTYTAALSGGRFERRFDPARGSYVLLVLEEPSVAFGDVYGDGGNGAVAVISANLGGSGTWKYLEVVVNRLGQPAYVASQNLGDRVRVNGITISSGVITVDLLTQGLGAGRCCPNVRVSQTFQLQGDQLVQVSPVASP